MANIDFGSKRMAVQLPARAFVMRIGVSDNNLARVILIETDDLFVSYEEAQEFCKENELVLIKYPFDLS